MEQTTHHPQLPLTPEQYEQHGGDHIADARKMVERTAAGLVVTSETIAEGAGVEHRAVLQMIGKNVDDLETFGTVAFEMRPLPGGGHPVRVALLNEQQSTLLMTYLRNTEQVKRFKVALVKAFYEMAQQLAAPTRSTVDLTSLDGISQILDAGKAALNRAIEAEKRAEVAETQLDTIDNSDGFSIRSFHKHYFSDVPERMFFDMLYRKRLLIDQRGARGRDENGRLRNGREHKHPAAAGKRYFILESSFDEKTNRRHHSTKVRPGRTEVELVALLQKWGFTPNQNATTMKELY